MTRRFDLCSSLVLAMIAGGCAASQSGPPAHSATDIDPNLAKSDYWFAKPGIVHVPCSDYEALWETAIRVAHRDWFLLDRTDYREGELTTRPLISRQFFEPWRTDVGDAYGVLQSSLGTVRRTIHFDIRRLDDGTYSVTPKVLVERHSVAEHRITSVTDYQDVFSIDRPLVESEDEAGAEVMPDYWYSIGRDYALERRLADQLRAGLPSEGCQE
jgi:hypothetical protein